MNFGEKLTNLRKQKGLSQEELGYELNVTRQTVSKWELGQTTPEMDKLVELSKIFGVTVDELTSDGEITNNEAKKIEDMPINDKPQNNSSLKVILIIVAIFIIGGIVVYGFVFSKIFNFGKDIYDKATNQIDEVTNQAEKFGNMISGEIKEQLNNNESTEMQKDFEENFNKAQEQIEQMQKQAEEKQESFKKDSFNNGFEIYGGTKAGAHVKVLVDKIITNNKKEKDKIITVIYKGENITDTEELKNIKRNFGDFTEFEVSFEYNETGYIYQAEIEEI